MRHHLVIEVTNDLLGVVTVPRFVILLANFLVTRFKAQAISELRIALQRTKINMIELLVQFGVIDGFNLPLLLLDHLLKLAILEDLKYIALVIRPGLHQLHVHVGVDLQVPVPADDGVLELADLRLAAGLLLLRRHVLVAFYRGRVASLKFRLERQFLSVEVMPGQVPLMQVLRRAGPVVALRSLLLGWIRQPRVIRGLV